MHYAKLRPAFHTLVIMISFVCPGSRMSWISKFIIWSHSDTQIGPAPLGGSDLDAQGSLASPRGAGQSGLLEKAWVLLNNWFNTRI